MHTIRQLSLGITATVVLGVVIGTVPAAQAKDGDVVRRGDCTGRTDWKVKVSPEDGRIELEGEVDSNRSGQVWRWRVKHDGTVVASGRRATRGASGSFEVRRLLGNHSGTDAFVFRARRPATGEVCRAVVRF